MSRRVFDYVICGGGTAGLVVAARLAEDPNVSVCVLEAGREMTSELNMTVPGFARRNYTTPDANWLFESIEQEHADGRKIPLPRGKVLGGSSVINFMQLVRGHKEEYDAIEALGNPGWNWDSLLPFLKKSESYVLGPNEQEKFGASINTSVHGTSGPIQRTLPKWVSTVTSPFQVSIEKLGVPFNPDSFSGDNTGISYVSMSIDFEKASRSSSASAYFDPAKGKENLTVVTGAHVSRLIFANGDDTGLKTVDRVEYLNGGKVEVVHVSKEVILSAGTFQTPQLLELSGIGDSEILQRHGIQPQINLPGVGKHLRMSEYEKLTDVYLFQDHPSCAFLSEMNSTHESFTELFKPERAAKEWKAYQETASGMLTAGLTSILAFVPGPTFLTRSLEPIDASDVPPTIREIQRAWLSSNTVPHLELAPVPMAIPLPGLNLDPAKAYFSFLVSQQHTFSRGSAHIASADPLDPPVIDLGSLKSKTDGQLFVESLKFARKLAATSPLSEVAVKEILPGPDVQTDEQLEEYIRTTYSTVHQPVGTASMMKREEGGVVDPNLKVYGTKNLRVIDASIIPIHISGHMQATVYGIAEKGVDILKKTSIFCDGSSVKNVNSKAIEKQSFS